MEESRIYNKLSSLKEAIKSLKNFIHSLDKNVNNASNEIRKLEKSVNDHQVKVDQYNKDMNQNFKEQNVIFSTGLNKLSEVLQSGFHLIDEYQKKSLESLGEFKDEAIAKIVAFNKSNSDLLINVTTGIALTELLKSAFISDESDTAIERSVTEHENRYIQVRKAIESRKQLFDKHIEKVFVSFFKQFKQIAEHIIDIQYRIFNKLQLPNRTELDEEFDKIEESDKIRTTLRQEKFDTIHSYIKDESISNFSKLRKNIEDDLSATKILHITAEENMILPVLSVPVTLIETNKWNNEDEKFIDTYGLNKPIKNIDDKMEITDMFKDYASYMAGLNNREIETEEDDETFKSDLLKGLEELIAKNYINKEQYDVAKTHLELYPINYLQMRS